MKFDNVFSLSISIDSDEKYLSKLHESVSNIKDEYIKLKNENASLNSKIESICQQIDEVESMIVCAFKDYFRGELTHSIEIVRQIVMMFEPMIKSQIKDAYAFNLDVYRRKIDELYLFKGRIVDDPFTTYKKEKMHLIPLNHRELIATQRYSMPGVPCLYLAYNSYVAWNELGKPSFDKLCISAFKCKNLENFIIDLTIPYYSIFKVVQDNFLNYEGSTELHGKSYGEEIEWDVDFRDKDFGMEPKDENYVLMSAIYPLLAAVSIHCSQKDRNFKSEYVIPQLLMYCLGDAIGIAYNSTALDGNDGLPATNLAIPIINFSDDEKYGPIKDYFQITDAVNVQYFSNFINSPHLASNNLYLKSTFNKKLVSVISGGNTYDMQFIYEGSLYYKFDEYLVSRDFFDITE